MVIVVHIRPDDIFTRNTWRRTYGDTRLKDQFSYSLLFSIGKPQKVRDQDLIEEEGYLYGDILQTDISDMYRNLTYKHLAELRYLALSCNENVTLLKLDDDVVWDIRKSSNSLKRRCNRIASNCSKRVNHKPMREAGYKWTVSKNEWEREIYPPHCAGLAYFASLAVVKRMLDTAYSQRFFW
ncbi:N-acetyllactosaminide 3-alpha-galactosyltransferase, partial [Ostertagia ostertagi]